MSKDLKTPRSRADSALSNLVLEGGKSRAYKVGRNADLQAATPHERAKADSVPVKPVSQAPRKLGGKH